MAARLVTPANRLFQLLVYDGVLSIAGQAGARFEAPGHLAGQPRLFLGSKQRDAADFSQI